MFLWRILEANGFFSIKEPGYFDATETKCLKPVHEALDNEVSQHYPKQSNVVTWAMTGAPDEMDVVDAQLVW